MRIDSLVSAVGKAKSSGEAQYLMGEIYFATIFWNNNHTTDPKMHAGRRTAIMRLQLTSANMLSLAFGCGVGGLAAALQETYGKAMEAHGLRVDTGHEADYLEAAKREAFRVVFKGGRGWRFNCLEYQERPNVREPLKPIDTKEYADFMRQSVQDTDVRIADEHKAGYVMNMSREFYVGPFMANKMWLQKFPKFHSYFVGGRAIQCAGIIRFSKGKVDYIDNESGHYKPIDLALVKALEHFKTVGMKLSDIRVSAKVVRDRPLTDELWKLYSKEKKEKWPLGEPGAKAETTVRCDGEEFLMANGNWASIIASGM
jgi:hypothetical protein